MTIKNTSVASVEIQVDLTAEPMVTAPAAGGQERGVDGAPAPLPRPARRPRRDKLDRGLGSDQELSQLARVYLEQQRKLWGKTLGVSMLPESTESNIGRMVEDFKHRHRGGKVDPKALQPLWKLRLRLGGSYGRFSSENSSSLSIQDQLVSILTKAHTEGYFIPWDFVYADYSISGLDSSRQGYVSYKAVLASPDYHLEVTFVDDFSRASRDEIEWWKLASLSKRLGKSLIGASDNFNLQQGDWDLHLSIYGLFSRLFIRSLQQKVRRGMAGAARRGTSIGKLPLGFTRRQRVENGLAVVGPDGLPVNEPCVDPESAAHRQLLYTLFVEKNWSIYRITRHFNELKVDGSDRWTDRAIRQLIKSATAIGVFVWNKTRRHYDHEAEKYIIVKNPRSQWQVRYDKSLAIVPVESWRAARRKLAEMRRRSPLTGRVLSKNQASASSLFSGTLYCAYCGGELKLTRSSGKYRQLACLNGINGTAGCKLTASKATTIIETCLLGYLRDTVLIPARFEVLVERANEFLRAEASKPRADIRPLKTKESGLVNKMKRLVKTVEDEADENIRATYHGRMRELQRELNELRIKIREAGPSTRSAPKPVSLDVVAHYLADLRETLNQEVAVAAVAIRGVTGRVVIRQEAIPGRKRGARWVASFSPQLAAILQAAQGQIGAMPTSAAEPADGPTVEVPIEKVPKYERIARSVKELRDKGASIESIAATHGVGWKYASDSLRFAATGERPEWTSGKPTGHGTIVKYKAIADVVVALRERQNLSFVRIAEKLGVGRGVVRRAYDHARPDAVKKAATAGQKPQRGAYSHLGVAKLKKIRRLVASGMTDAQVARRARCGKTTVQRVRVAMATAMEGAA